MGNMTLRTSIPIMTCSAYIAFSLSRLRGGQPFFAGEISVRLESTSINLRRKFVMHPIFLR